ncbi:MAG TPA: PrsW family glutamic-type intramembrane protease [Rhizomicrobium sp.]
MSSHFALKAALGFGPVLLFLAGLVYLDSFKLVRFSRIVGVVLSGMAVAALGYFIAGRVMAWQHLTFFTYSRYYAPFLEEALKALVVIALFSRNRIGFMIDAAILGLAVGAGFSISENVYYAYLFPDANVGIWIVRGLGTALMHAGTTAIFAISAQALRERHAQSGLLAYLPGYLVAASLHLIFNQFTPWPFASTIGTILVLPLALLFLFDKSEHEAHDWLIHDYESHEHLLEDIRTGRFTNSEAGRFIASLAARFGAAVSALIFAYIKLHTELVLRAENRLLAKERGERVAVGPGDRNEFARLHALERQIGHTALLVIWPHLKFSRRELFELHEFDK